MQLWRVCTGIYALKSWLDFRHSFAYGGIMTSNDYHRVYMSSQDRNGWQ